MSETYDTRLIRATRSGRRWVFAALAAVAVAGGAMATQRAFASDHQDAALVELNPGLDMTDFYAFPGAGTGRIALVHNSWAFLTPAQTSTTSFDNNLLYQVKVDNTGDAKEDLVFQVKFNGSGASQTVQVWGPIAPPVIGSMRNKIPSTTPTISGKVNTVLGSPTGMQVFAGAREEPFFIDLEQFFRIVPDRKPVTGPLAQLPNAATAGAFRTAAGAVNFTKGFNVLSIVIELPVAQINPANGAKLGLWGTISR